MKKYFFIFKSELMTNMQYIFNILTGFIAYFLLMYIFLNLWSYIYSNPSELINGYNMNQMIWYVIVTELLWGTLGGRALCKKISNDVKGGNIAYNINKPYNYIWYSVSSHLGSCAIKFIIYIVLSMLTGYLFLHSFPNLDIFNIILILIVGLLSLTISTLLITFIGLFSFIVEDSSPFYWLYSKFILVLGTIFPIEYFPSWAQGILRYSPVYVTSYGPAKLFVNFSYYELINVLIAQIIYLYVAYFLCALMYKKGVKNLNVNGG